MVIKALFVTAIALISTSSFAADVTPTTFGVQYATKIITNDSSINFNMTISSGDLPSMNFKTMKAEFLDIGGDSIVEGPVVFTKSLESTIVSTSLNFSLEGLSALLAMKSLETSIIKFNLDNGDSFSVNLAMICQHSPEKFVNIFTGKTGCNINDAELDKLITEEKLKEEPVEGDKSVCEENKAVQALFETFPLKELCFNENRKVVKEGLETSYECNFKCEE